MRYVPELRSDELLATTTSTSSGRPFAVVFVASVYVGLLCVWATVAQLPVTARLDGVVQARGPVHPLYAPSGAVIRRNDLVLGKQVTKGEILLEFASEDPSGQGHLIVAPLDGQIVRLVGSTPGKYVKQSTELAAIEPTTDLVIRGSVGVREGARVKAGQVAFFENETSAGSPSEKTQCRVARAIRSSTSEVVEIDLEFDSNAEKLRLGDRGEITIITGQTTPIEFLVGER